jgi:hypothetical protein
MPGIETAVAYYLCGIMLVLGILSYVGFSRQKEE